MNHLTLIAIALWMTLANPAEVVADVQDLLQRHQQLRDQIFSIRATVVHQGCTGVPLNRDRKYLIEAQWLQKGDRVRVDFSTSVIDKGVKNTGSKETFVYSDGTRSLLQTSPRQPDWNVVKINPPHDRVPPHSLWRFGLFEFWSNRFDDPKGPGRVSYQQAARFKKEIGISRIESKPPAGVAFFLDTGATEQIEFSKAGLVIVQTTTSPDGQVRIQQEVVQFQNHQGIEFPRRVESCTWNRDYPGEPLVQAGSTDFWIHSINEDIPDWDFALPKLLPRTEINYPDNSFTTYDATGKVTAIGELRSPEQVIRDLTPLPPESRWWPWIVASGLAVALIAGVIWRRQLGLVSGQ